MTLVCARGRIEDDDTTVAGIGDVQFVRASSIASDEGRLNVVVLSGPSLWPGVPICRIKFPPDVNLMTCASPGAAAAPALPATHQPRASAATAAVAPACSMLAAARAQRAGLAASARLPLQALSGAARGCRAPRRAHRGHRRAGRSNPNISLAVYHDSRTDSAATGNPARAAPTVEQPSRDIEFKNLRRRVAALRGPGRECRPLFVGLQGVHAAVRYPDVILRIDGNARNRSQRPMFLNGEWLRPQGIHLQPWRLRTCGRTAVGPA